MTTYTSKDVSHIAKFNGTDFSFWKYQVLLVLEQHHLLKVVNGTETCPAPTPDAATGAITNQAAINTWTDKDVSARSCIFSSVEDSNRRSLISCKTSAEMWIRLATQYQQNAAESKHIMVQKFYKYEFEEGNNVMTHISTIEGMALQLSDLGTPIDQTQLLTKIIMTLPPSFQNFQAAWDLLPDANKNIGVLTSKLIQAESMNKHYGGNEEKDAAFFSKQSKTPFFNKGGTIPSTQGSKTPRQRQKCTYCGYNNHSVENCRKKIREETQAAVKMANQTQPQDRPAVYEDDAYAFQSSFSSRQSKTEWFADSGASQHMTDQRHLFSSFGAVTTGVRPVTGIGTNNEPLQVKGSGEIKIRSRIDGVWHDGKLSNVLYVPNIGANLFSIGAAADSGVNCNFTKNQVQVCRNNRLVAVGTRVGKNLYHLDIEAIPPTSEESLPSAALLSLSTWHRRFGHVNYATIQKMSSNSLVSGLKLDVTKADLPSCEGCAYGKSHRKPFPTVGRTRGKAVGDLIHTDVCGPMSIASPGGARYFIVFKDDFTGYRVLYFMKHKSEAFSFFQQFAARLKAQTGNTIKTLRSDNGGEYIDCSFENYLIAEGIRHESSAPHTPQQNGVSERKNRTVMESARSMLYSKGSSSGQKELWAEAVSCAVYTLNRASSRTVAVTPFEGWYGVKPDVSHLKIFGCSAYVHIPQVNRRKLDPKSEKCIFVGYSDTQKAYRFWNPQTRKLKISRDAIFCEEETPFNVYVSPPPTSWSPQISSVGREDNDAASQEVQPSTEPERRYPDRNRLQAKPRSALVAMMAKSSLDDEDPMTYNDAISSVDAGSWNSAMQNEMAALDLNKTWTLTTLPPGRSAIKSRWVYKLKRNSDGSVDRYRARLVAKGFTQRPGIDFDETYSPVVKHDSLRAVLAIAGAEDLELLQMDVTTAFLHGELEEELYLHQPEGFAVKGRESEVYRLHKSLYGLKQASRTWNQKFDDFLTKFGLTASQADPCVYYLRDGPNITIVAIWVDDGLVASSKKELLSDIIQYLKIHFEITFGPADVFVGLLITRDRPNRTLHLSQPNYINKILTKFNMLDCHPKGTPADPNSRLTANTSPLSPSESFPYREAVGSLMYCMISTRPDISYAVGQVAQFSNNPGKPYWEAVKRILAYLKGTADYGICFIGSTNNSLLSTFSDADYAGDLDSRRSTTGYLLMLNQGPVAWTSRRQQCTTLSTTEAEYVAACEATKETVWMRNLLQHVGPKTSNNFVL